MRGVDFFHTRTNPGAGSEAHDGKSAAPAGRSARRQGARREIVAEQNCDFAAAPARAGGNFDVAASHRAREVSPLRISPEGRRWPRTGGGPKCASMHYFASAFRPGCLWWSSGGGIAAQRADRIRRSFVLLKRCCALQRLALLAPARTARPQLAAAQPHAVAAPRPQTREVTPKPLLRKAR